MGQTTEEEFPNSVSWCPLRVGSWVVGGVFFSGAGLNTAQY